jgi:stress-induced morphogen
LNLLVSACFSNSRDSIDREFVFILEQFTGITFSPEVIEEAGVCHNCFIRFNEYDEHRTTSEKIQLEIVSLFESNNVEPEEKNSLKFEQDEVPETFEAIEEADSQQLETCFESLDEERNETAEDPYLTLKYEWTACNEKPIVIVQDNDHKPRTRPKAENDDELIVIHLEDNTKLYKCEICQKTFKEKSKLKSHRLIHTTERNVVCQVRFKEFPLESQLHL